MRLAVIAVEVQSASAQCQVTQLTTSGISTMSINHNRQAVNASSSISTSLSSTSLFAVSKQFMVRLLKVSEHNHHNHFMALSGTTQVSRCQKRTSGLHGARED